MSTTPAGPSPDRVRLRALFDRAMALPPAERADFVRREAADDPALVAELLAALAAMRTANQPATDSTEGNAGERVRSTATDELLAKLAKAPRLDTTRIALGTRIGEGGMGEVFLAQDNHLHRRLAIKTILARKEPRDDEERQYAHQLLGRFLEEAQITSQLDHPGVVPVHELGLDQHGKVWFSMRLVKGRTASEVFADAHAQQNDWTLTRALEVVLKICDTMSYAHEKGVLHRDLKPSNVMVGRFGEVYVMDWGLARVLGQAERRDLRLRPETHTTGPSRLQTERERDRDTDTASSVVTMDGAKLGTPSYMAPEQARGQVADLDARADVYAVGAMLYELVTGRAPYTVPGVQKPAYRILEDVVDGPPKAIADVQKGVPAELVAIIGKAMHRDREPRYVSMAALAADLRAFLASKVVSAYRTGALVELRLWVRRNRSLAASLAAAVLILVVGIVGMTWLANQNAALAQEKTELATAETKAKDEATQLAREKGQLAEEKSQLAEREGRTVKNFNQLSGVVRLQDALAKERALWPAWPDKIPAMKEWLERDCGDLLAMRPQIEATVAELRSRALPLTAEQVESDRRAAADWPAFERQQRLTASWRRAQAIRSGAALELPALPDSLRSADAAALNAFAWPRVAPEAKAGEPQERTIFAEEAVALVVARAAVAASVGHENEHQFLDTLAWAALANGQDAEAAERSAEALANAPDNEQEAYAGHERELKAAIAESAARLEAAEARLRELEATVAVRRTWLFGSDEQSESARFLHDALMRLLDGLAAMAMTQQVDVRRRLLWAEQVGAASRAHPKARVSWAKARAAIAKADGVEASALYAGKAIAIPEDGWVGLVPIGVNPVTRLWEFYDLRSAWDGKLEVATIAIPEHKADGSIEVTGATGIVFVLLPGGKCVLGAQKADRNGPNYDEDARPDETLHEVTLAPFLLARHELTRGQWERLSRTRPFWWNEGGLYSGCAVPIGPAHPADSMDWDDASTWMERHGLSLPTEAQWEYGCRAGTLTVWWPGSTPGDLRGCANVHDQTSAAEGMDWGTAAPFSDGFTPIAPVGRFRANAFGLHDVHGNVWEWCRDPDGDYGSERDGDGLRTTGSPSYRSYRGGSYDLAPADARSADRSRNAPSFRSSFLGLRPARIITE